MLCQDEALLSDPLRWPDFFAGLCRGNVLSCSSSPPCHFINPSSPTSDFIQKGFWSTAEGLGSQTSFCCAVQEEVVDSSKNPCCVIFRTVWGLWWRRRLALSCSPSESHLTPAGCRITAPQGEAAQAGAKSYFFLCPQSGMAEVKLET